MHLFGKEQKSVQGEPGRERYEQLIKKIKERAQQKKSTSVPKVEKKDTSAYGGKPYLKRWEVRQWFRKPETYKIIPLPKEKRAGLEKELFGPESGKYGPLIEKAKREPERVLEDLRLGRIKPPKGITKERTIGLLQKFLGQK